MTNITVAPKGDVVSVTPMEVWAAALADPKFAEDLAGDVRRDFMQPFIETSVKAMLEHLDKPLTLQTLAACKIAFVRYCLENNFAQKISELSIFDKDSVVALLKQQIEDLEPYVTNPTKFAEDWGTTEQDVMLGSTIGLNPTNQAKWKAGMLTVADVLRTQPSAILKNS